MQKTDVPARLYISVDNDHVGVSGVYYLQNEVNGYPMWQMDGPTGAHRWLYSSLRGLWTITDSVNCFSTGWGYVVSKRHDGVMPQHVTSWRMTVADTWVPATTLCVKTHPLSNSATDLLQTAIQEEEAIARNEEVHQATTVLLSSPIRELNHRVSSLQTAVIDAESTAEMLQAESKYQLELTQTRDKTINELNTALDTELHRSAMLDATAEPLKTQTYYWKSAAQDLMQARLEAEQELQLQHVKASAVVREKDLEISNLKDESFRVHNTVTDLGRELEFAKLEAQRASTQVLHKDARLKELEMNLVSLQSTVNTQQIMLGRKKDYERDVAETQISRCVEALADVPLPSTFPEGVVNNEIDLLPSHDAVVVKRPHARVFAVPIPDEISTPNRNFQVQRLSGVSSLELDDDLPDSPLLKRAQSPIPELDDLIAQHNTHRSPSVFNEPSNHWPTEESVINSLANLIRENRLL